MTTSAPHDLADRLIETQSRLTDAQVAVEDFRKAAEQWCRLAGLYSHQADRNRHAFELATLIAVAMLVVAVIGWLH